MGGEKMKTPRELLLERHKAAMPALDALRHKTINAEFRRHPSSIILEWPSLLWRELIWPCRGIWATLATVWVLIFAANIAMSGASRPALAQTAPSRETIMAWRQQQRFLIELTGLDEAPAALPVRSFSPRPTSQRLFKQFLT
jgi:hypothetical protein